MCCVKSGRCLLLGLLDMLDMLDMLEAFLVLMQGWTPLKFQIYMFVRLDALEFSNSHLCKAGRSLISKFIFLQGCVSSIF